MTDAAINAAEQVLHDAGMLLAGPPGPCPDRSHSPRLRDDRWACPDCDAPGDGWLSE